MKKALFPGSFDPFTIGHADIVARGLQIFDEIIIAIGDNISKTGGRSATERRNAIESVYANEPRVQVVIYDCLTTELAEKMQAAFLLRGVRRVQDFEYEMQMAEANREMTGIETVLLYTRPEYAHISSTLVRDLLRYGKDVQNYLPQAVKTTMLVLLMIMSSLFAPAIAASRPQKTTRIDKSLTIYNDVLRQLDINYVDTLNYEDLIETSINAMLRYIDPYTVYYPAQKDDDLKMMTTGKYGGIGAIIQQRGDTIVIANPYEDKPAQKHNVLAGDKILSVDGWKAIGHSVKEVSDHLRGIPGTTITLKLEREGENKPLVRTFEREQIHMEPVDYACVLNDSIAYIAFSEFTEGSARDFTSELYKLVNERNAKRLIIDLRGNGGGIVDEAMQILSNFLDKGTDVVSTKGKIAIANRTYSTSATPYFKDLPLVVLVDKNSASASEIVAGALQDLGRAKLIGQRTFGKGLVQNLRPIAYNGHLKITTSKYYLPSGRCIQAIDYGERQRGNALKKDTAGGILPDIVMSDSAKYDIAYSLYIGHYFFDYSTRYHREHATIEAPEQFQLSDAEIEDFIQYLDQRGFIYETETAKYFKDVIRMAENEDLDSTVVATLKEIAPQLRPSYRQAILRNKEEIKNMLGADIVERYYFQRGRIAFMLRSDEEVARAIEELQR